MAYLRTLFWALLLCGIAGSVKAQCPTVNSAPSFNTGGNVFGYTGPQWASFFGSKADANHGILCNVTIEGLFTLGLTNFVVAGPITSSGPITVGNVVVSSNAITIDGAEVGLVMQSATPNLVLSSFMPPSPQTIGSTVPINTVPTSSYTLAATDGTGEVDLTNSSAPTALTVPAPTSSGFGSGYSTTVCPLLQATTATPSGGLIDGLSSIRIPSGTCADLRSNGIGWQAAGSALLGGSLSSSNLTSCGSSPSITGTDISGNVVPGTGMSSCTITFHSSFYTVTPTCVVTGVGTGSAVLSISSQSSSAITIADSSTFNGTNGFNYACMVR